MTPRTWLELTFHFLLLLNSQLSGTNSTHDIPEVRGPFLQRLSGLSGREAGIVMVSGSCSGVIISCPTTDMNFCNGFVLNHQLYLKFQYSRLAMAVTQGNSVLWITSEIDMQKGISPQGVNLDLLHVMKDPWESPFPSVFWQWWRVWGRKAKPATIPGLWLEEGDKVMKSMETQLPHCPSRKAPTNCPG